MAWVRWRLALLLCWVWVWVWVRSAGLRAGRATPNGRAHRPMYPAKSALAQEGGSAKLIAGNIPKLRHSTATWSGYTHTRPRPHPRPVSLFAQLNLASGQLAARTRPGVGLLFPANACLLCWLAGGLAAQGVRCSTTCSLVAHHLVYNLPISLSTQALQTMFCAVARPQFSRGRWGGSDAECSSASICVGTHSTAGKLE